ncbi:MAG: M28 family peptidase [Gemmatimonadota bacterium]|nr:MAG: M28 family peptidase [Gemmatimonadota bacterium]
MALCLTLSVAASGCSDSVAPETTIPISEAALLDHLNFLADDSLYGRRAGTPHELQAAHYVRDEFVEYGLKQGVPGFLQAFVISPAPLGGAATVRPAGRNGAGTAGSMQDDSLVSHNVIGVLTGQGRLAGQWVILGAHYDHVGWEQITQDSIVVYNGADDNASGTSLLLEIARFLSHYLASGAGGSSDHRSIMFHAYGAEELGFLGAFHYAQNPTVPPDSIVAMINLDMVGRLRNNTLIIGGAHTAELWDLLLNEANDDRLVLDYNDGGLHRSDQYPFYLLGKPVLFFHTGLHAEYHQPEDDVWLINLDGMLEVGNLALTVLRDVAIREERPVFDPGGL